MCVSYADDWTVFIAQRADLKKADLKQLTFCD